MYYIGIDVHKVKCVAAIKQKIRDEPVIITFENTQSEINDFICKVKANYMPVKHPGGHGLRGKIIPPPAP